MTECYDFTYTLLDPYNNGLSAQDGVYVINESSYEGMLKNAPFTTFFKIEVALTAKANPTANCPPPQATDLFVTPYSDLNAKCKLNNLCSGYDDKCK